jgi:ABC-type lipoprotein release transport system permease subunit
MKGFKILQLSLKYLCRHRRRYVFLFLALVFGFAIVTVITSVKDGMYENVYNSSQAHYAGDIVVIGQDKNSLNAQHMSAGYIRAVMEAAERSHLETERVVKRTNFTERGVLFFNGAAVNMKYILGVDWNAERPYFDGLDYTEAPRSPLEGDGVMALSAPVADILGARQGDSVILEGETQSGQKNTAEYVIAAVVNDSTFFGFYKAYVSRTSLNRFIEFGDGECSIIGFYAADRRGVEKKKAAFQAELEKLVPTGPLVKSRAELDMRTADGWEGIRLFVTSIPVLLSEVSELLNAINILSYFLYAMMLLIILVSASVTYSLILHERMRELGTMRAMGFYGSDVMAVLVLETFALGLLSLSGGFIAARVIIWALGFLSFSWFPSFEIFMRNGRLTALYRLQATLINVAALFCMLLAAVWYPAFRSVRSPLPRMLSGR